MTKLHPKYGPNPTMPICFLCGKEKGDIALLGAAYKEKAPKYMVLDKEPCDTCKSYMEKGIMLICVKDGTDHNNPYRTGDLCVISEEAAKRAFKDLDGKRSAFIEQSAWNKLGLPKSPKKG
jgi:hypothetical protein